MIDKILVSINCTTFNHAPYIEQCLRGFLMQRTNFEYEVLIHDDASTDDTVRIIKKFQKQYPHIIKPIYQKENQYSKGTQISDTIQIPRAKGKYIAVCEGDDYWTDQFKLQKQVDFLEANPDYALVYSKVKYYDHKNNKFLYDWGGCRTTFEQLLKVNTIATLSVLCRTEIYKEYALMFRDEKKNWLMGDFPLWLWFSLHGKIKFQDEVVGVYRLLESSASHFIDKEKSLLFKLSRAKIAYFFAERENILSKEMACILLWRTFQLAAYRKDRAKIKEIRKQLKAIDPELKSRKSKLLLYLTYIHPSITENFL